MTIGTQQNYITITRKKNEIIQKVPIETVEGIHIIGKSQVTAHCVGHCLNRGISVMFYSKGGKYFGRLQSTGHTNPHRQRKQAVLGEGPFADEFCKRIIDAKLHNQTVLLRRYARNQETVTVGEEINMIQSLHRKIWTCESKEELLGIEGVGAKFYFQALSKLVDPSFSFKGRSRRPPQDEFNAMLGFGYTVLMNELYGKIEARGLNPYFGFLHNDRERHPTLVSDLMEEWRAIIVDATVMSLVNGHEIRKEHFRKETEEFEGYYLTDEGMKIFLNKLEKKMRTKTGYFMQENGEVSFRRALELQVGKFSHAIEEEAYWLYEPVKIR